MTSNTPTTTTKTPTTFPQFPDLLLEIRLKIWHHTYPAPQKVRLDLPWYYHNDGRTFILTPSDRAYVQRQIEAGPNPNMSFWENDFSYEPFYNQAEVEEYFGETRSPLPISLRVNRESREETLRSYVLKMRSEVPGLTYWPYRDTKERPFCVDPRRDTLYVHEPYGGFMITPLGAWLSFLRSKYPRFVEGVKKLEIQGVTSNRSGDEKNDKGWEYDFCVSYDKKNKFEGMGLALYFPGLEELTLVSCMYREAGILVEKAEECKELFTPYLTGRRYVFRKGRVPNVTIVPIEVIPPPDIHRGSVRLCENAVN